MLAGLIRAFGTKRFPIDRFKSQIETMVAATPAGQKKAGEECVKSIYLWESGAVDSLLTKMKASSSAYLKGQLEEFKSVTKDFKVKTRSEQGVRKKGAPPPKPQPKAAPVKVIEESKDEEMPVPPSKDSAEKTDATVDPAPPTTSTTTVSKPAKPWLAKKQPVKDLEDSSAKADSAAKVESVENDVVMKEEQPQPEVKPWQDTAAAANKDEPLAATTEKKPDLLASVDVEMKQASPAKTDTKPAETKEEPDH